MGKSGKNRRNSSYKNRFSKNFILFIVVFLLSFTILFFVYLVKVIGAGKQNKGSYLKIDNNEDIFTKGLNTLANFFSFKWLFGEELPFVNEDSANWKIYLTILVVIFIIIGIAFYLSSRAKRNTANLRGNI